jgi:hypothetical protein
MAIGMPKDIKSCTPASVGVFFTNLSKKIKANRRIGIRRTRIKNLSFMPVQSGQA